MLGTCFADKQISGQVFTADFTTVEVWTKQGLTTLLCDGRDVAENAAGGNRGRYDQTETEVVLLPPKSPNMNAYLERFMRSLKSECLGKMIFFGQKSLEHALKEYVAHYYSGRNHQGMENLLIDPGDEVGNTVGEINNRERLGKLLNYYYRDAAWLAAQ